jgi:hypothetical protein
MIRRLALAGLIALFPAVASAQFATIGPTPPTSDSSDRLATTTWVNNFFGSGLALASGKIIIGSAGGIGTPQSLSGDCTLVASGAITCATLGGVSPFNASNLSSGSLPAARLSFAAKADQQAGTSTSLIITPSQQQQHDSAAKAWSSFTGSTGAALVSYNGTPSRTGTGSYALTFTVPFATANYSCTVSPQSSSVLLMGQVSSKTASAVLFATATPAGVNTDPTAVDIICFGRQ